MPVIKELLGRIDAGFVYQFGFFIKLLGNIPIIKLVSYETYVNAKDKDGQTALHIAAKHGNKGSIEKLIANGANPNTMDKYGNTLLDAAETAKIKAIITAAINNAQIHRSNDEKGQLDILPNDEPAEVQKLVGIVDDNDV